MLTRGARHTFLFPLFLVILATAPARASAQSGLVPCPTDGERVTTYSDEFGRVSSSITVGAQPGPPDADGYAEDLDANRVGPVTVGAATLGTPISLGMWPSTELQAAEALIPTRSTPGRQTVAFDWDQDLGTNLACHGHDEHSVPIVSKTAKVGATTSARLVGKFRVRYVRYDNGAADKSLWTARPRCVIFACSTRVTSTGGLKNTFRIQDDNTYRATSHPNTRTGTCTTTNAATGAVIKRKKPALRLSEVRTSVRVVETRDGSAYLLTGKRSEVYKPLPGVRCSGSVDEFKISARRVG